MNHFPPASNSLNAKQKLSVFCSRRLRVSLRDAFVALQSTCTATPAVVQQRQYPAMSSITSSTSETRQDETPRRERFLPQTVRTCTPSLSRLATFLTCHPVGTKSSNPQRTPHTECIPLRSAYPTKRTSLASPSPRAVSITSPAPSLIQPRNSLPMRQTMRKLAV